MTSLNWNNPPSAIATAARVDTPWFAVTMGLLGLILGFALHRFIVPTTLGAQVAQQPTTQAVVVQPSPTKPAPTLGGGCGCGGGACGAALAPNPPTT